MLSHTHTHTLNPALLVDLQSEIPSTTELWDPRMDSPAEIVFRLPGARDRTRQPTEWQEAEMLSSVDSDRCYSIEMDRSVILAVKAGQPRADGPSPPERTLRPGRRLQAAAQDDRMGTIGTEGPLFEELAGEVNKGAAGTGSVSGALLQHAAHPRVADLEKHLQEVLNINKAWDKQYRRMKQHYDLKVQQLRDRLATCDRRATEVEEELERRQRDFEDEMLLAKETIECTEKRNSEISAQLLESEKQMRQLKLQQEDLATRGKQQGQEIRRLNKVLQDSLAEQDAVKTELEVLRHQAHIYKTDFKLERQDRERLKAENLGLEKVVARLCTQPSKLRSSVKGQQQPLCSCANHAACPTRSTDDPPRT
ncbi:TNFAIP3-interacting protein 1-like isoform X1 [Arapaima gigas]